MRKFFKYLLIGWGHIAKLGIESLVPSYSIEYQVVRNLIRRIVAKFFSLSINLKGSAIGMRVETIPAFAT